MRAEGACFGETSDYCVTALRAHLARVRHHEGSKLSRPLNVLDGVIYFICSGSVLALARAASLAARAQVLSAAETWDYWAVTLAHLLLVCDVVRVARWADLKAYLLDLAAALPGALARSALHCAISGRRPGGCRKRIPCSHPSQHPPRSEPAVALHPGRPDREAALNPGPGTDLMQSSRAQGRCARERERGRGGAAARLAAGAGHDLRGCGLAASEPAWAGGAAVRDAGRDRGALSSPHMTVLSGVCIPHYRHTACLHCVTCARMLALAHCIEGWMLSPCMACNERS